MDLVQLGDRVLAVFEDGRSFIFKVEDGKLQTHHGIIDLSSLVGKSFGSIAETHTKERFYVLKPRLVDEIYKMKRQTQIVYPKDMGFILLMLDVYEGKTVIDAGVGSGAMCAALARAVGKSGKVYAYERREEFKKLAEENLTKWGLIDRVEIKLRDISEGFDEVVDAIFLDVPDPWNYIRQCYEALKGSGNLAIVCPTTNQVQLVLEEISKFPFINVEVWENLFRQYKAVAERLRPFDRMVAHTAYMIFARKVMKDGRD